MGTRWVGIGRGRVLWTTARSFLLCLAQLELGRKKKWRMSCALGWINIVESDVKIDFKKLNSIQKSEGEYSDDNELKICVQEKQIIWLERDCWGWDSWTWLLGVRLTGKKQLLPNIWRIILMKKENICLALSKQLGLEWMIGNEEHLKHLRSMEGWSF